MHTLCEQVTIKNIVSAEEKDHGSGEIIKKEKPKYVRSFAKAVVRISFTRVPIALEKASILPKLGQFILRDEKKTIGVGKVLKYIPQSAE